QSAADDSADGRADRHLTADTYVYCVVPCADGHTIVMSDTVAATVRAALLQHQMVEPGDTVVVAVSGGPDSLCLLHILSQLSGDLGIALHVAHLDPMLRGAESAAEAAFVDATARAWGLPATVVAADVPALARSTRMNLHQAARSARYHFLAGVAQVCSARAV